VRFLGFREDVPELLHACDLFAMSSHLEGLCTSVMDAMAAGKAVVVAAAGGLPELVEDGKTGLVVPPKNPEALAKGLLDLLEDRKKREHFGRQAQAHAQKKFGRNAMVEANLAVYREMRVLSVEC
jgi:glycosyltransferase involved in cell wall biosynthesis